MEPNAPLQEPEETASGSSGGLYKNVRVKTRTLDVVILALLAVVLIFTLLGGIDPGFVVRFDARGGSDVDSIKLQYGDTIPEPDPPTREGYDFDGWYLDENCYDPWDFAEMTVSGSVILYAAWTPEG